MYIVANIPKEEILTGLIYMYLISVLKVEKFETNCLCCIIVELIF